jgi:hypothetical protein
MQQSGLKRAGLTALGAALALSACGSKTTSFYPAADAAGVDRAIERGWLPQWLPSDAVTIDERHDLDSNASIVQFDSEKLDLPKQCKPHDDPPPPTLSANWWNDDFAGTATFRCGDRYVAVDGEWVRTWIP